MKKDRSEIFKNEPTDATEILGLFEKYFPEDYSMIIYLFHKLHPERFDDSDDVVFSDLDDEIMELVWQEKLKE